MTEPSPPDTTPESPDTRADGVIRSEEELLIATELVETGRARLIKRIETETVTRTIQLRREVLEIENLDPGAGLETTEPLSTIQSGPLVPGSFVEGVVEIVLMQEEALITTQMVPRERIRLTKRVISEDRTIDADLQVEHVDLDQHSLSGDADHG